MELGLDNLIDGKRIVQIDADVIPAPPHARYPGNHLYVNCHYDVSMSTTPLAQMYQLARTDALKIVRQLATNPMVKSSVSIVVRVQGHFPSPGAQRPARRRIYEVSMLSSELPAGAECLTPEHLTQMGALETSQLDDIAELMHQPTS